MPPIIRTRSTSPRTSKLDPIVLREGPQSRLVFIPMLVQNDKNAAAGINGEFLYQKKARNAAWIDYRTVPLTSLKTDEGYVLNLKSAELLQLYVSLKDAYQFREQKGTPQGEKTWVETPQLSGLGKMGYAALAEFLIRLLTTQSDSSPR